MSFPRYERYKDSGLEWLGEVPEHWDVVPMKRAFTIVGGSTPSSEVETYWGGGDVWVTPADLSKITDRYISKSERTITKQGLESCSSSLVPAGSIVLSTRAPIGSLAIAGVELCTNQGCKSLVPMPGTVSNCYAFLLNILTEELRIRGKGTTFLELSADALGSVEIPRPPTEEQQRIGNFLEGETAKIDALTEEQRRLIELLKEKRQAVISHAVTKGLNAKALLRDSKVDWVGQVPRSWNVTRLGYFATVENGTTPSREKLEYWMDGQIPWLASGEVNQLRITEASEFITEQALAESSLRLLPEGTIVVGLVGQGKTRGMSAILRMTATINQNLAAICPGPKIISEYILYLFQATYESLREDGRGGNQAAINCKMLTSLQIPVPPISEQKDIIAFLDNLTEQTNTLESQANKAIRLLQERRSALISAAVTGKIDVRNYTPKEAA